MINQRNELLKKSKYTIDLFTPGIYESPCFALGFDYYHSSREELNQKIIELILLLSDNDEVFIIDDSDVVSNKEKLITKIQECFEGDYPSRKKIELLLKNQNNLIVVDGNQLGITLYNLNRTTVKVVKKYCKKERLEFY